MKQHGYSLREKLTAQGNNRVISGALQDRHNIEINSSIDTRGYNDATLDRFFRMHKEVLEK